MHSKVINKFVAWSRFIVGVVVCISAMGTAHAGTWSGKYTLSYPQGESETRASLRRVALEDARSRASNEFGSVVMNKQEIRNDELVEQTKVVSAGLIKLVVERESTRLVNGGVIVDFVVRADVNDDEVDKQLASMRDDVRKSDMVRRLGRENAEMRRQMLELRDVIGKESDVKLAEEVSRQINVLISRLSANGREINVAFEAGSFQQAAKTLDEASWDKLNKVFFRPIMESPVRAELLAPSKSEGQLQIRVRLYWDFDLQKMTRESLDFSSPQLMPGGNFSNSFCARASYAGGVMDPMGDRMEEDAVAIKVSFGDWSDYFMVGGSVMKGMFCVLRAPNGANRTLVLSIPEKVASEATTLSVKMVRMSEVGQQWKTLVKSDLMSGSGF